MSNEIMVGDIVKVRIQDGENSERIWAIVKGVDVEKQTLTIELNNKPVSEKYKLGEILEDIPVLFVLDKYVDETGGE